MARNGSGTYTVPNAFVAGTTITAADHNENWSDAANELTNSVAADGQTTLTGPLKFPNGSVSLPAWTFGSDTNTGGYRIGADNLGFAVGGAKVVDISASGVAVTGTLTPSGQILAAAGTVALPAHSFTDDPDSGTYRIGANNLGIAVNGAKVLDIGTAGLSITGTLTSSGALTVTSGGATITAGGLTVTAGNVAFPAGSIATAALATAPAFVLISTAVAATNAATISFVHGAVPTGTGVTGAGTVVLDNTYDEYLILVSDLTPATDDTALLLTVGTGAGPTYASADYYFAMAGGFSNTGSAQVFNGHSTTALQLGVNGGGVKIGNGAGESARASIRFSNPEASGYKVFEWAHSYFGAGGEHVAVSGGGHWRQTTALTAVRLAMSSGNISAGRASLYGIRKS
jgi:hypothetical protein